MNTPPTPPQTPPQTPPPATPPTPPEPTQEMHDKGMGPLIGTGIILILIILGGLYIWHSYLQSSSANREITLPLILGDDSAGLPPTSSSDSVNDIEADINATDLDTLEAQIDADLQAIDSTL